MKTFLKSKKAMDEKIITFAVIALFSLIILLVVVVKNVGEQSDNIASKLTCKESVRLHTWGKFSGNNLFEDINCPTRYDTLETGNELALKKTLAEDYYFRMCDSYLQGKEELFHGDGVYCAIDAVVSFDGKGQLYGVQDYFATTPVGRSGISYIDYCQGHTTADAAKLFGEALVQRPDLAQGAPLDLEKEYAFVMIHAVGIQALKEVAHWYSRNEKYLLIGAGASGVGVGVIILGAKIGMTGVGAKVGAVFIAAGALIVVVDQVVDYFAGTRPDKEFFTFFTLMEYNKDSLEQLGCQELAVKQGFKEEDFA